MTTEMQKSPQMAEALQGGESVGVDTEATLLMIRQGSRVHGRILELSLTGCTIGFQDNFHVGVEVRVEANFKINGIAFRFSGVTEWSEGGKRTGIRFVDVAARRADELTEVLAELTASARAKAEKETAEKQAAEAAEKKQAESAAATPADAAVDAPVTRRPEREIGPLPAIRAHPAPLGKAVPAAPARSLLYVLPVARPLEPEAPIRRVGGSAPSGLLPAALGKVQPPAPPPASAKPAGRDRRTQSRHEVDTSAEILLVNVASRLKGRILNLSAGGCRIRTDERFPVGIYTRVEAEFHLEGLPFRLGGVVQAIQDRQHIGIRFLDMSERKRDQLEQLMGEIAELEEREKADKEKNKSGQTAQ